MTRRLSHYPNGSGSSVVVVVGDLPETSKHDKLVSTIHTLVHTMIPGSTRNYSLLALMDAFSLQQSHFYFFLLLLCKHETHTCNKLTTMTCLCPVSNLKPEHFSCR